MKRAVSVIFACAIFVFAVLLPWPASAGANEFCAYGNKGCVACQRKAFQQWKAVDCFSSDRQPQQMVTCSRDMTGWLRSAKLACIAQTKDKDARTPASTADDDRLFQDTIDEATDTARRIAEKCNIRERYEHFKDFMKSRPEAIREYFQERTDAFFEFAREKCN